MNRRKQSAAWDRATERGRAAALKPAPNPYAYGSYCWMLFERGRVAIVSGPRTQPQPRPMPPVVHA